MTDHDKSGGKSELSSLGWLFLITILLHVIASLAAGILAQKGIDLPVELALIFSEFSILVPSILYILVKNLGLRRDLGFRPIKAGTFLMCILLSFLVSPMASFVNVVTQLFVENTMLKMSDSLLGGSHIAVILLGALYGPLCEELTFRGVFFRRYTLYTGPMRAALISALLFGLAHLNINQAAYAFVLGFVFSVINVAADSIYPSMIIHACINGSNLLFMFALDAISSSYGVDNGLESTAASTDVLYVMMGVTLVAAMVCTLLVIPCVIWISKHEGCQKGLRDMFCNSHPGVRWLTFSTVIAVLFVVFIMFGLNPLLLLVKDRF